MKHKVTKWVLQEKGNFELGVPTFLARPLPRHGHDVVTLDDECVMLFCNREMARDYAKSFEGFVPRKVTMEVEVC